MKNINLKNLLPHGIAIAIFLLVTVIFCKPALEPGVVMQQSDITQSQAMARQSVLYKEAHGTFPLWTTSMFCGMPAYNILFEGAYSPLFIADKTMQLWLPKPLNFFFLSCICFYILCICLRLKPYIGIIGSLAFAYSSYNPIIAAVGHDTKLLALAYAPALIGSIVLIFDKKYLSGFVFTALFASLHFLQNHAQISYYTLLIILLMGLFFLAKWIKEKAFLHIFKVIPIALSAVLIGFATNAIVYLPVADYAKQSKRGGQLVMNNTIDNKTNTVDKNRTTGLSREYAFQWSYGKMESMSLLFPGITGYGTHFTQRDDQYSIFPRLATNSNVGNYLQGTLNLPEDQVDNITANLSGNIYWGDKPFTSGSVYLGASICCLFILGLFLLDNKHKWWLLSASIFGILLAMGKNLPEINNFIFDYLPLYNKFRTPEMALVIPQILFPIMAVLCVQAIITVAPQTLLLQLKRTSILMAAIFAIAGVLYFSLSYSKENKERTNAINAAYAATDGSTETQLQAVNQKLEALTDNRVYENLLQQTKGDTKIASGIVSALRLDRQSFFGKDILHSLLFVALSLILIGLLAMGKIKSPLLIGGVVLLTLFDLVPFDMHYINAQNFEDAEKYSNNEFPQSAADKQILADTDPNFRVFNVSGGDPFQEAKTSYYHKSIGGYHPAKLGIYDDLITYQMSGKTNMAVLNMLNAKYVIQSNPQTNAPVASPNQQALGNCWFVRGVKLVNGQVEEMKALDNFNPKDTAIIDNSFQTAINGFEAADSSATIRQTAFDNMAIQYQSQSSKTNLAVFSEIFYKDWNAYIDGKPAPVAKANYVLRALLIPAGKHQIEFKFEPKVFQWSYQLSKISSWMMAIILLLFGGYCVVEQRKKNTA